MANDNRAVFAWLEAKLNDLSKNTRDAVKDVVKEGEETTREYIATRGIKKPGRIDTGAMIDSVGSKVEKETDDVIIASFGFYDGPAWTPYQELGTRAIAPMYALTDAAAEAKDHLEKKIGQAVKRS